MIVVTVGLGLDQRRAATGPGPLHRAQGGRPDRGRVHTVADLARHAVGRRAIGNVGEQHVPGLRGELGIAVVLADEHHRQAQHGGEVGRLMEAADVGGAVAEEGHRDGAVAAVGAGERRAHRDRDARAHDPVRAEHADRQVVDVHAPAPAVAVAVDSAIQFGEHPAKVRALGDRMAMPAVGGGDLVFVPQRADRASGDRLLPDVEMQETGQRAGLHQPTGLGLEHPDAHHPAVQVQEHARVGAGTGVGIGASAGIGGGDGHGLGGPGALVGRDGSRHDACPSLPGPAAARSGPLCRPSIREFVEMDSSKRCLPTPDS